MKAEEIIDKAEECLDNPIHKEYKDILAYRYGAVTMNLANTIIELQRKLNK